MWNNKFKILKKTGLIGQNKLSSYSFILMMIYYLIIKNYVPNILRPIESSDYAETKITIKRSKLQNIDETFQIENFFVGLKDIDGRSARRKFSLYESFKGFLNFYGEGGEFWANNNSIICLDQLKP
jgi:hypothetical protein